MAHVSVTINGKTYRMACDEGQEAHLTALAEKLDSHVGKLKGSFGEIGDQRLTVMAGIMVADELSELQRKAMRLEAELIALREKNKSEAGEYSSAESAAAGRIEALTDRITLLAGKLSGKTG